ncbi:vesicle-associated protein 1-4-like isoform X1 [Vicia villosa]|uniref:vesicle-associated protein 1-4-like isoform X1 n=1 Tax=Vicia villosa TaxID=3911 RepID=UPI00273C2AA7|nr:vesicle-associated protein 1-4-like isoform X1 [Vicia villosa]
MGQTVSNASSSASKLLRLVIPRRYASPLNWGYEKLNNQDDNFHLQIHPQELQFPFELKKQISCSLQLLNKSDNCVAFKVKTTHPKKYCVKPNNGVVLPRSTFDVRVIMQAQTEAPPDMQCPDKFLFQSIVAKHKTYHSKNGATTKDFTPQMFDKEFGYEVKECKLRVIYIIPPQPRPPVQEGYDKDSKASIEHFEQCEHVEHCDTSFEVHPQELQFPFELRKQISCSLQLSNKSDNYVAFMVKTTNPKRYGVKPNRKVMLPRSSCDVIVTMKAQKETPLDMRCKDKFLIQSVVTKLEATTKDITSEMFNKKLGYEVEESKLKVIYVDPSQLPSPIQEESDEYLSPRSSVFPDQAKAIILKLTEERDNAIEQNKRLEQELELLRNEANNNI